MKRYNVIMTLPKGESVSFDVLARDSRAAQNKAVRRARIMTHDKTISAGNVESVTYEGFYLARRFFSVDYLEQILN